MSNNSGNSGNEIRIIGLEKGKRYLFMTVTFYWEGRVVDMYPSHVTIENAVLVKDIGEEPDFKKWPRYSEVKHMVRVPIPGVQIIGPLAD
jgi:hypothetical protein